MVIRKNLKKKFALVSVYNKSRLNYLCSNLIKNGYNLISTGSTGNKIKSMGFDCIDISKITKFKEMTNCPVLVNTSFNIRGEPIVHTPEDAFKCFMGTELDTLVVGNYYLKKDDQNQNLKSNYIEKFELD